MHSSGESSPNCILYIFETQSPLGWKDGQNDSCQLYFLIVASLLSPNALKIIKKTIQCQEKTIRARAPSPSNTCFYIHFYLYLQYLHWTFLLHSFLIIPCVLPAHRVGIALAAGRASLWGITRHSWTLFRPRYPVHLQGLQGRAIEATRGNWILKIKAIFLLWRQHETEEVWGAWHQEVGALSLVQPHPSYVTLGSD